MTARPVKIMVTGNKAVARFMVINDVSSNASAYSVKISGKHNN
jgi:hypothetical protein